MINELSRRKFLKLSSAAAAAGAFGLGVRSPKARAMDMSISTLLSIDEITLAYTVLSPCCNYCTDYFVVNHYQPVVLCEVIKGGGDSAVGSSIGSILSAGVDVNDYTSMDVNLYEIPDWAVDMAMNYMGCKMCGVDAARQESDTSFLSSGLCGQGSDQLMGKLTAEINDQMPDCFPKLLYSSMLDTGWDTGCRDWLKASPAGDLECSSIGSAIGDMFGLERCIGANWGPLYPRQMASQRDNPIVAAGIAAYRALHVARNAIGSLPFDASLSVGKLQQTSPAVTVGFGAGSMALHMAMLPGTVSSSHIYTFVWWVPVVCCKTMDEIMGMCEPEMPCSS